MDGYMEVVCPVCGGTATFEVEQWEEAEGDVVCDECDEGMYELKEI